MTVTAISLTDKIPLVQLVFPVSTPIDEVLNSYSMAVLKHHKGNVTHAAKSLGISQRTLQRWNKKQQFKG